MQLPCLSIVTFYITRMVTFRFLWENVYFSYLSLKQLIINCDFLLNYIALFLRDLLNALLPVKPNFTPVFKFDFFTIK